MALTAYPAMLSRARRLATDWADAEDLVQEAFTAALRDWGQFRRYTPSRKDAWLTRVMVNKQVDRWRTGRRHSIPVAEVPELRASASAEQVALDRAALRRCDQVISTMPLEQRKTAFLRWYCGWTTSEIARWNGVAASTVRVHLSRALKQLNEEARPHMPFVDDLDEYDDRGQEGA
jgi:RNA polymerase sigma factor (sigma-70 family)